VNGPTGERALVHAVPVRRPVPVVTLLINENAAHKHHLLGHAIRSDVPIKDEDGIQTGTLPARIQSFERNYFFSP